MIGKSDEQIEQLKRLSQVIRTLPDLIQFLAIKFDIIKNAQASSKDTTAGPGEAAPLRDHCIKYFEAFLQYPIELEGDVKICPRVWALALQQTDLKSITRVLWRGVQNQDGDMDTKKEALRRPVIWMLDKKQDPWRFNLKGKRFATAAESLEMDQVYNTFDKTDNNPKYRYDCKCKLCSDDGPLSLQELLESLPGNEELPPPKRSNVDPEVKAEIIVEAMEEELKERLLAEVSLIDMFHWTMENRKTIFGTNPEDIYPVDVLKFLTLQMLPNCKDVFVGPVQHSYKRWRDCFKPECNSNVLRWNCLFRKYRAIYFPNDAKLTYDEICPLVRLSLAGGVAWITNHIENDGIFGAIDSFDSKILGHNMLLSETDFHQIESWVNEKYGPIQNLNVNEMQPLSNQLPPPSPSLLPYMHEGFSTEDFELPEINPLLAFNSKVFQNSAPQSFCNNMQVEENYVAIQPRCPEEIMPFPSSMIIPTTIPQMTTPTPMQTVQSSQCVNSQEVFTENILNNESINHPQELMECQAYQMLENIPSCSTNPNAAISHHQFQSVPDGWETVEIEGYRFPIPFLEIAERDYENDPNGAKHAGQFFFENLFSNDEILNCNKGGKKGKAKFDRNKYHALLEAVLRLKMKWNYKKINEGQSLSWSEVLEMPVDELTRNEVRLTIEKSIFVDRANHLRTKLRLPKTNSQESVSDSN